LPKNRPVLINIITITAYFLAAVLFCFQTSHAELNKELHYTVQAGSYVPLNYAEKNLVLLEANIPEHMRDYLRIEYSEPYYTVRIGKFDGWKDSKILLEHVKKYFPDAYILKAYIKKENIKKKYGQINEDKIKPSVDILRKQEEQQPPDAITVLPHTLADQYGNSVGREKFGTGNFILFVFIIIVALLYFLKRIFYF
jgi:hypothetical protein